jgi:hypothetical protein
MRAATTPSSVSWEAVQTKTWMAANLREKDLLVVGFWSDWSYLNAVLAEARCARRPRRPR